MIGTDRTGVRIIKSRARTRSKAFINSRLPLNDAAKRKQADQGTISLQQLSIITRISISILALHTVV